LHGAWSQDDLDLLLDLNPDGFLFVGDLSDGDLRIARAISKIEPFLTDTEKDFLRKGRNKAGRGPKNVDAATYAIATGFETIVGWLFLKNPNRLADLFDLLDRPIN